MGPQILDPAVSITSAVQRTSLLSQSLNCPKKGFIGLGLGLSKIHAQYVLVEQLEKNVKYT